MKHFQQSQRYLEAGLLIGRNPKVPRNRYSDWLTWHSPRKKPRDSEIHGILHQAHSTVPSLRTGIRVEREAFTQPPGIDKGIYFEFHVYPDEA